MKQRPADYVADFLAARGVTDVFSVVGGGAISRIPTVVGVGTIITAFFMGPLIEFFNQKVARPLLKQKS